MRDLDAELSRNAEALRRWESRSTRAMNMLVKLRKERGRIEKRMADHKANARDKREARKRKQQLPPPPVNKMLTGAC